MPFPNFHAAVVVDKDKFKPESFRTINIGDEDSGITAIIGRLKGETTATVQSYRFDEDKFTVAKARKWLKDHDIDVIEFTPALDDEDKANMTNKMPTDLVYKAFTLDITKSEETKGNEQQIGIFTGAMASEHLDRGNDIISSDAFDKSLERYHKSNRNIRLFYQHNTDNPPIGIIAIDNVEKKGKFWKVKGELNLDTQLGREVYSLLKQKALSDLSIGFSIEDYEYEGDKKIIKQLELWEVSVVSEPMNERAQITDVKGEKKNIQHFIDDNGEIQTFHTYAIEDIENNVNSKKDFENILRESGTFSRKAAIYLASRFEIKQSESVDNQKLNEVISSFKELNLLIQKL